MKKTRMFLLLISMLAALTFTSCGGGSGGGDGAPSGGGGGGGGGPTSVNVPETGQTTSYATGDDGDLQRGIAWPSPRFTVDGTGFCVTDNLTGLMWVRMPDSTARTWANALTYANVLSLCGYDDWRLPNRKELRSLINYGQPNSATWLNAQVFSNVQAFTYWSSSTYAIVTAYAWVVYMYGGVVYADDKTTTYYVWPVRAGDGGAPADLPETGQTTSYSTGDDGDLKRGIAWPNPRFTDNGNGTITDNLTGLIWLKRADCMSGTWNQALSYVNISDGDCGLTDGSSVGDWRLPNVNELESLINAEQADTAAWLNTQGFSNVQAYYYWSSSTYAGNTTGAWGVNMYGGYVYADTKSFTNYVWPVRAGQ